jgi:hypothetical protein
MTERTRRTANDAGGVVRAEFEDITAALAAVVAVNHAQLSPAPAAGYEPAASEETRSVVRAIVFGSAIGTFVGIGAGVVSGVLVSATVGWTTLRALIVMPAALSGLLVPVAVLLSLMLRTPDDVACECRVSAPAVEAGVEPRRAHALVTVTAPTRQVGGVVEVLEDRHPLCVDVERHRAPAR